MINVCSRIGRGGLIYLLLNNQTASVIKILTSKFLQKKTGTYGQDTGFIGRSFECPQVKVNRAYYDRN